MRESHWVTYSRTPRVSMAFSAAFPSSHPPPNTPFPAHPLLLAYELELPEDVPFLSSSHDGSFPLKTEDNIFSEDERLTEYTSGGVKGPHSSSYLKKGERGTMESRGSTV